MELRGNATAMTQAGPMSIPAPRARSWLPLAGALGLAVVVGAALLGGYGIVLYRLRHSRAGRAAVAQVLSSSQLLTMLGAPLRVRIEGGELQHQGRASFSMRVTGPKGRAQVELESRLSGRQWRVLRGTVSPERGGEVPLDLTLVRLDSIWPAPESPPAP